MLFLPFFPVLKSKEVLPTSFLFLGLNDVVLTMSPNKRLETSRVSSLHLSEQGLRWLKSAKKDLFGLRTWKIEQTRSKKNHLSYFMVMSKAANASSSPITHIEVNYKGNQLECSRNTGAGFRLRFLKSFLSCRFTWNSLKYSYGAAPTPAGYKSVALSTTRLPVLDSSTRPVVSFKISDHPSWAFYFHKVPRKETLCWGEKQVWNHRKKMN